MIPVKIHGKDYFIEAVREGMVVLQDAHRRHVPAVPVEAIRYLVPDLDTLGFDPKLWRLYNAAADPEAVRSYMRRLVKEVGSVLEAPSDVVKVAQYFLRAEGWLVEIVGSRCTSVNYPKMREWEE